MKNTKWEKYWNNQQDPRHSINEDSFFEKIASEITFHLGNIKGKKILEIGCGDGALLKFLKITPDQYVGVDFSESLLDAFKISFPEYRTHKSGGVEFLNKTQKKYDVIFSYGVLQYFDEKQLKELFELQAEKLTQGGVVFHFGIPVLEKKALFISGKGVQNKALFKSRSLLKRIKSQYTNNIGHWHSLGTLCDLSQQAELEPNIYGGMHYLYRVNLVQMLNRK